MVTITDLWIWSVCFIIVSFFLKHLKVLLLSWRIHFTLLITLKKDIHQLVHHFLQNCSILYKIDIIILHIHLYLQTRNSYVTFNIIIYIYIYTWLLTEASILKTIWSRLGVSTMTSKKRLYICNLCILWSLITS